MKKVSILSSLFLGILITMQGFSQNGSVLIQPSNDEVLATKHGGSEPNLAGRYARGTASAPTATLSNDALTSFSGRGYTGTSFTGDRARITMTANENFTSVAGGSRMTFLTTANGTTSLTERMRITHDGLVGIGTSAPDRRLHLYDASSGASSSSFTKLMIEDNTTSYITVASPETSSGGLFFSKPSSNFSGGVFYNGSNALHLYAGGSPRVYITSTGSVGIGTSTPTAKLDIEGDIVIKKATISSPGTYNALNRSGGSSIYFSVSGTVTLNGIAGGVDGMLLYIFTAQGTTLNINNLNAGAVATNQIATNTGATVTISGRGGATLIYDSNNGWWRIIGLAN